MDTRISVLLFEVSLKTLSDQACYVKHKNIWVNKLLVHSNIWFNGPMIRPQLVYLWFSPQTGVINKIYKPNSPYTKVA